MSTNPNTGEYLFGPPISIAIDIGDEHKPIELDLAKIGANLQRDFPVLSQEDWERSNVLLTELSSPYIGGISGNVATPRKLRSARMLLWLSNQLRHQVLSEPKMPSYKDVEKMSNGKDVLSVVNLNSKATFESNPFANNPKKRASVETILGHELKHSADLLLELKATDSVEFRKIQKQSRSILAHAGVFISGVGLSASGLVEELLVGKLWDTESMASLGIASITAGVIMAGSTVYNIGKRNALSNEKFGIKPDDNIYAHGEKAACAYTVATEENWRNTVTIGRPAPYDWSVEGI